MGVPRIFDLCAQTLAGGYYLSVLKRGIVYRFHRSSPRRSRADLIAIACFIYQSPTDTYLGFKEVASVARYRLVVDNVVKDNVRV